MHKISPHGQFVFSPGHTVWWRYGSLYTDVVLFFFSKWCFISARARELINPPLFIMHAGRTCKRKKRVCEPARGVVTKRLTSYTFGSKP